MARRWFLLRGLTGVIFWTITQICAHQVTWCHASNNKGSLWQQKYAMQWQKTNHDVLFYYPHRWLFHPRIGASKYIYCSAVLSSTVTLVKGIIFRILYIYTMHFQCLKDFVWVTSDLNDYTMPNEFFFCFLLFSIEKQVFDVKILWSDDWL